ncbi:MAG: 3-isopropylmalate dehydratase small subunit [Elusimicrobia bacterium]|nr:3-isopropylmalate dehydratase small subunit [Elusimicrobiota bacterium]
MMKGKAWKFGDDISTDHIAPGRLFHLRSNLPEMAKHVLEDADAQFASKMSKGDFVVAGNNFGLGSSREHAPTIIKLAGVSAVLAKSFARIFFRNAINIGLLLVECDTDKINAGDEIELDVKQGFVKNLTTGENIKITPLPDVMLKILDDGGLMAHIKKHGKFDLV